MDNLSVKIKLPSGVAVERQNETAEKRMKADSEYTDVGWRALGVPFGGPIKGRDLDGEAFHEDTDIWLKVGDKVPVTYYHGFGPDSPDGMQNPDLPLLAKRPIPERISAATGLMLNSTSWKI